MDMDCGYVCISDGKHSPGAAELLPGKPSSHIDVDQRESEDRESALVFIVPMVRNIVNFPGCL